MACGRTDLLSDLEELHALYRLCGEHFESRMFLNNYGNRLQPNAVPTKFSAQEGSSSESVPQRPKRASKMKLK